VKAKSWIIGASAMVLALTAAACGSSSPSAPSDVPGALQTTTRSGATINGSVTGAALTGTSRGLAAPGGSELLTALGGSGLTVTVDGTNLSAMVDAAGNFVLNGVPAGDVRLRFSGPGTNATVTVTGVNSGEEIRITVNVNGANATLELVARPGAERQAEIEGRVTSVSCPSFVVNGTTITTDSSTQFSGGTCATLAKGVEVEVKGVRQGDGSVLARRVEIEDEDDQGQLEIEGVVTAGGCGSFTVRGIVVTTNSGTRFHHGSCSDIKPGVEVEVRGTRASGTLLATRVDIEKDDDDDDDDEDDDEDDDGDDDEDDDEDDHR